MSRPINDRFFGPRTLNGQEITGTADIGAGPEPVYIVNQRSNRRFRVASLDGVREDACITTNKAGPSVLPGELSVPVTSVGVGEGSFARIIQSNLVKTFGGETQGWAGKTPEAIVGSITPHSITAPQIVGRVDLGETVTADVGVWDDADSIGYEWLIDGVVVGTANTAFAIPSDYGIQLHNLSLRVTATNEAGVSVRLAHKQISETAALLLDIEAFAGQGPMAASAMNAWEFNIPLSVDWGDGSPIENAIGAVVPHNYSPGVYQMKLVFNAPEVPTAQHIYSFAGDPVVGIARYGDNLGLGGSISVSDAYDLDWNWFKDTPNIRYIPLGMPPTIVSTGGIYENGVPGQLHYYFRHIGWRMFREDISQWNIAELLTIYSMFYSTTVNANLSNWNLSGVTSLRGVFNGATINANTNISSWDVSGVTDMRQVFNGATIVSDIGAWNVGNVTNMQGMFTVATVNTDLSNWDVSNVTNMIWMFDRVKTFNQDLSSWCVTKILAEPTYFARNATSWTLPKPVWGTCPP